MATVAQDARPDAPQAMVIPTLELLAALWALIRRAIVGGVAGIVINLLAGMAALAADMQS